MPVLRTLQSASSASAIADEENQLDARGRRARRRRRAPAFAGSPQAMPVKTWLPGLIRRTVVAAVQRFARYASYTGSFIRLPPFV